MNWVASKSGIGIVVLLIVVIFGLFQSGVFGETTIGVTIKTNPTLENGLVAHYTFDGEVESGNLAWGILGSTTVDFSTNYESIEDVAANDGFIYTVGAEHDDSPHCLVGNNCWRISAFNIADGTVFWSTTTDPSAFNENPYAADITEDAIFVAGNKSNCAIGLSCFHMQSLSLADGSTNWTQDSDVSTSNDELRAAIVVGDGLYVAGEKGGSCAVGGDCWLIERRSTVDGSLAWSAESDPSSGSDDVEDIASDGKNIFVVGTNETDATNCPTGGSCWRIEARAVSNGSLSWATTSDMSDGTDALNAAVYHNQNIYLTGSGSATTPNCDTGGSCVYIEARSALDGSLIWATSSDPDNGADVGEAIATDGTNLYIAGTHGNGGDCNQGGTCLYMESRLLSDGSLNWATTSPYVHSSGFTAGIQVVDDYFYVGATASSGICPVGNGCGVLEKRALSDGSLYTNATSSSYVARYGGASRSVGNIGQAMSFDGVDDYVRIADAGEFENDFSVAFWAKMDSLPAVFGEIVAKWRSSSEEELSIHFDNLGNFNYWTQDTGGGGCTSGGMDEYFETADSYAVGDWHHFVVTMDRFTLKQIYVDGAFSTSSAALEYVTIPDCDLDTTVGSSERLVGDRSFDGSVDDLRIYDRVLPPAEISRLYDLGATTKVNQTLTSNPDLERGLELHYTFDANYLDRSSSTAEILDRSGNDRTGNWLRHSTTTIPGVIGQGLALKPGTTEAISIPEFSESEGTNTLSVGGWYRFHEDGNSLLLANKDRSGFLQWELTRRTFGEVYFRIGTSTGEGGSGVSVNDFTNNREWNHIMGVLDGDTVRIYVNGIEESSQEQGGVIRTDYDHNICIGTESSGNPCDAGTTREFDVDDFRIYSRTLSASEVKRLYELGATTKVNQSLDTNPDLQNGLVGHWNFDGAATYSAVADLSGNGNTGYFDTNLASGTAMTSGRIGQGILLDGIGDDIKVGADSSIASIADGDHTLAGWYKGVDFDDGDLIANGASGAGNFLLQVDGNGYAKAHVWTTGGDGIITGSTIVDDDTWHHLVQVVRGTTIYLYVDGAFETSKSITGTQTGSTDEVVLGSRGSTAYLNGTIDDIRIYDRALSNEEITRLYELGN